LSGAKAEEAFFEVSVATVKPAEFPIIPIVKQCPPARRRSANSPDYPTERSGTFSSAGVQLSPL
jgi:hypothetical protein